MNPNRLKSFKILLESLYEYESAPFDIFTPEIASDQSIQTVHETEYIKALKIAEETLEENIIYGLGFGDCPIFPNVEKISRTIVGGTLKATEMALNRIYPYKIAFNVLGGLHHALPSKASGFCYYNDCNIAIEYALKNGAKKVLYIDTDTHAGDGVNRYFYNRNDVLTLSIHETGLYLFPGTDFENEIGADEGKGFTWNLPIIPGTSDDEYIPVVLPLISKAFEVQKPDIVFWQCGVDTYILDPLAHIRLTTRGYQEIAKRIRLEIGKKNTPIVMMGGGGYSPIATARGWLTQFLTIIGIDPLPTPKDSWIRYCKELSEDFPFCDSLIDNVKFYKPQDSQKIRKYNESVANQLLKNISDYI